jgi:hypothetical protein
MSWAPDKNEKLMICFVILLGGLVFLRACPAKGQATPSDEQDPVPLAQGEPAPFAGDLWPAVRSVRMLLRAEHCEARSALHLDHARRRSEIELEYERARCEALAEGYEERIGVLRRALAAAQPWHESPSFVATVSVLATLAGVLVVAVIIEAALSPFAGSP